MPLMATTPDAQVRTADTPERSRGRARDDRSTTRTFLGSCRPAGRAQHGRRVEDAAAAVAQAHRLAAVAQAAGAEGARPAGKAAGPE